MQPPLWPQLFLQVILIALRACFSASETALRSLNEAEVRRRAEEGDQTAARILPMLEKPAALLSDLQTGITFTGCLSAAFAAVFLSGPAADALTVRLELERAAAGGVRIAAVAVVTLFFCFMMLLFGTLIPRGLAAQNPYRAVRTVCPAARVIAAVLRPLSVLLSAAAGGALRLVHIDPNQEKDQVSEEGIRMMVDIGEEKGTIQTGEKEMIENIFELNNTTAGDVMVHRTEMELLWVGDAEEEILSAIETTGLSRFPVYEEDADDIIGILNTRDWLLNVRRRPPKPLTELLRPAYFVPESVRADVLFRDMQSRKVHLAIVVDEYGGTSGLVTMEDLLEEIVGNIYDEFDPQEDQEIIPLGENLWRIAGGADLDDVAEALGVEFPEEAETLGGLVFSQLSVIPEDGSHPEVRVCGLHIRVEELLDRRVEWALVSKLLPGGEEEQA